MPAYIDKVNIYCDSSGCDSMKELNAFDNSDWGIVLGNSDIDFNAEISDMAPSWDIDNGKVTCANCLETREELLRKKEELQEVIAKLERI